MKSLGFWSCDFENYMEMQATSHHRLNGKPTQPDNLYLLMVHSNYYEIQWESTEG